MHHHLPYPIQIIVVSIVWIYLLPTRYIHIIYPDLKGLIRLVPEFNSQWWNYLPLADIQINQNSFPLVIKKKKKTFFPYTPKKGHCFTLKFYEIRKSNNIIYEIRKSNNIYYKHIKKVYINSRLSLLNVHGHN